MALWLLPGTVHASGGIVRWANAAPCVTFSEMPLAGTPAKAMAAEASPLALEPHAAEPIEEQLADYVPRRPSRWGPTPSVRTPRASALPGLAYSTDLALDPPALFWPAADDIDWVPITPIDPAEAPFTEPAEDPFAAPLSRELLGLGHFVDSRAEGALTFSGDGVARRSLRDAASSVHEAAYPELFTLSAQPHEASAKAPAEDTRGGLRPALARPSRGERTTPFLVLRPPPGPDGPHAALLPVIGRRPRRALRPPTAPCFAVPAAGPAREPSCRGRAPSEASRGLLDAVQAHLHAVVPARADAALRTSSAPSPSLMASPSPRPTPS